MPRTSSNTQSKGDRLKAAREAKSEKQAIAESDTAWDNLWTNFNESKAYTEQLERKLSDKVAECEKLRSNLENSQQKLQQLTTELDSLQKKYNERYQELRLERQTAKRRQTRIEQLEERMKILKEAEVQANKKFSKYAQDAKASLDYLKATNSGLEDELAISLERWDTELSVTTLKLGESKARQKELQKEVTQLRKQTRRGADIRERAVAAAKAKIEKEKSIFHLMKKGVFTNETRNLVQILVRAGCSRNYINEVIVAVLKSAGVDVVGGISRTSVSRILREGYIAAQIQLGYEMQQTEAMTFSADGTSHRSINYVSRHVHLMAEDYSKSPDCGARHRVTRFLGIQSTKDGSSEEAIKEWESALNKIIELYNSSPLAKREGVELRFIRLLTKLVGMNSDHCAKEKKDARMLQELKNWAVEQSLGEDAIFELTTWQIDELFEKAQKEMIKNAGGKKKWDNLSESAKSTKQAGLMENILSDLGKKELEKLPEDQRRILQLFIWAGCGCHKDLNTIRAGYMEMSEWWKRKGLEGPILLANRDNDSIIQERSAAIDKGDIPTPAQDQAFDKTTRGAIKLAQIAGALLNHKDDKKGHHDVFRYWWWEHMETPFTFPDTSNNRFQSYCDAAAALLLYNDQFLEFLETLRINKQNSRLNHMEQNFSNALQCDFTKSELAVLSLYAEAVSYPYMKSIRTSDEANQNMLNLGPLHSRVYKHIETIIENPDLLLGKEISPLMATLNGEDWQNPPVILKIQELAPSLPYLRELLVIFFPAALETWERFTSEFAPGGAIDQATTEEKELAWLPATNDENEGALRSFRRLIRHQPQLTLLDYNALAMFFRNNTQAFMAVKFTEAVDYQHLRHLARKAAGDEKKRRIELVQFREQRKVEKQARKEKRKNQKLEREARLAATAFVWDATAARNLKGEALKDMLRKFTDAGAPNLANIKLPTRVNDIRDALCEAIALKDSGEWVMYGDMVDDTSDTESDSEDDNDDNWEDL